MMSHKLLSVVGAVWGEVVGGGGGYHSDCSGATVAVLSGVVIRDRDG